MASNNLLRSRPIAVVLPFFQHKPGILQRALASVAAQIPAMPMTVIVVDDASPIHATAELAQIALPEHITVRIVEQTNGGPGDARNTALNELDAIKADYVAFLDSDDEWDPAHLMRARTVLDSGATAYFANHRQLGQDVPAFERAGRLDLLQHEPLSNGLGTYLYRGDMLSQVMFGNVIGTSTVVYSHQASEAIESVRFRTEFRNAGEDYLFWIDLTVAGAKWGFSTEVDTKYGAGVNVYSAAGWGTPTHFLRVHNEARYCLTLLQEFTHDVAQRKMLKTKLRDLRIAMVGDLLYRIRRRKPLPWGWMADVFRCQPAIIFALPSLLVISIISKFRKVPDA